MPNADLVKGHTLVFDIETDGFLDVLTRIHSLCIKDLDDGREYSCCDRTLVPKDAPPPQTYGVAGYCSIEFGLSILANAEAIVGHNIITFDIPAIKKLYPAWQPKGKVWDTLTCSRLIWSNLKTLDFRHRRKNPNFPGKLIGSHGLEAWGHRLGVYKGEFGKTTDWSEWSLDMQTYCEQDVIVTDQLWELIKSKNYSKQSLELEHRFQDVIQKQEENGFGFDEEGAHVLHAQLVQHREEIYPKAKGQFKPWWAPIKWNEGKAVTFTPKADNKRWHYVKGAPMCKIKLTEFNPGSRDHIINRFQTLYDWKPSVFTDTGKAKIDDDVLGTLDYPEAAPIAEYLMVKKRLGQLADGAKAWLKFVKDGKVHGGVLTNNTATGRCAHVNPNVGQVPSLVNKKGKVPYGKDCRELWLPTRTGWVQIGCDASGLELRCLSHFMARYDDGAYANEVLSGDIHSINQAAAGLPTRDNAKTFIYAYLYGAGDVKLGSIIAPYASEAEQRKIGAKLRRQFQKRIPAIGRLREDVVAAAKSKGFLKGIDGRILHVRSLHSALNLLLQSAGALICKQFAINLYDDAHEAGLIWGEDWAQMAHVHDEVQLEARPEIAEDLGEVAVNAIRRVTQQYNWRIPLDGEYIIGKNWAETH